MKNAFISFAIEDKFARDCLVHQTIKKIADALGVSLDVLMK